jgi:hypothetical protein
MPDSKITALTSIGASTDPANDPLVLVDVSDTSMAASGTTKKVTLNQLLGASGTATLASATITGDLTVDTSTLKVDSANNRVGVNNATPGVAFHIGTTSGTNKFCINTAFTSGGDIQMRRGSFIGFSNAADNANSEYMFANGGALEFGISGSTAMTLNSTGLGVGMSPSAILSVLKSSATQATGLILRNANGTDGSSISLDFEASSGTSGSEGTLAGRISGRRVGAGTTGALDFFVNSGGTLGSAKMTIDSSGNVGVGVTPSYKFHALVASGYSGAFKASTAAITGVLIGNTVADLIVGVDASGNGRVTADTSKYLGLGSNGINDRATLDSAGNFVVGIAAVATTATDGFLYVTGCAGTPTGTPTAKTGRVPIVVDTTNNKLYFYSGGSWVAAN